MIPCFEMINRLVFTLGLLRVAYRAFERLSANPKEPIVLGIGYSANAAGSITLAAFPR